jgi:hypothetical protein
LDNGIIESGVVGKCLEILKVKCDLRRVDVGSRMLLKWMLIQIMQENANSVQLT